jgi:catechol 2,3-dioxygenase-like lactoylglutathione lyase family enzyme
VSKHTPFIDFDNLPAPIEGFLVTHFITVRSVARSRAFYSEVLGGQVVLEENPCMIKLSNSWVIMNPGGGPTPDKPDILRRQLRAREHGVQLHEPARRRHPGVLRAVAVEGGWVRDAADRSRRRDPLLHGDPDGRMIEVGQSTGLLEGELAKKRPDDLPG